MSSETSTSCDFCGRLVVPGQTKCACGSRIAIKADDAVNSASFDYGKLLPYIPLAGFLACLYIIINPEIVRFSGRPIFKVWAIVSIASAAVAAVVADRAEKHGAWDYAKSRFRSLTPVSWFLGLVFVWPLFFPAFLQVHYERANPNRAKLAYALGIVFIIAFGWVYFVVKNRPPAINRSRTTTTTRPAPAPAVSSGQLPSPTAPAPDTAVTPGPATSPAGAITSVATSTISPPLNQITVQQPQMVAPQATPRTEKTPGTQKSESQFGIDILRPR